MNTLARSPSHALPFSHAPALAIFLLALAGMPAKADTSFTGIGWLCAVPSFPGITVTNSHGQVFLRGNTHVVRILSEDARGTGRLQAWMDLAYQTDGTAIFSGPAYSEVGTWDAAGTTFTPSGGVWALTYNGIVQADGSSRYSMAGYGIGGNIEGMRLSATMTRSNSEPTTPYIGSGTIKPAPVDLRDVVDDFEDYSFAWPWHGVGPAGASTGTFFASETNHELTIGGTWTNFSPRPIDSSAWAEPGHPWAVTAGQTIEARVSVTTLSQTAAGVLLALWNTADSGQAYFVSVGRNGIAIGKEQWNDLAFFRAVHASIKDTNIVLSLALTPVGKNVSLTGKVLDKDNDSVIVQVVATDTPASDPTLSAEELAALTGGKLWLGGICTDPARSPFTSGVTPLISIHQESDVAPVTAFATFDNLELRTFEVPQVGCERALRIFWPRTGMGFVVERASDPKGPYLPVQNLDLPDMNYITIPANGAKGFFILHEAPAPVP